MSVSWQDLHDAWPLIREIIRVLWPFIRPYAGRMLKSLGAAARRALHGSATANAAPAALPAGRGRCPQRRWLQYRRY